MAQPPSRSCRSLISVSPASSISKDSLPTPSAISASSSASFTTKSHEGRESPLQSRDLRPGLLGAAPSAVTLAPYLLDVSALLDAANLTHALPGVSPNSSPPSVNPTPLTVPETQTPQSAASPLSVQPASAEPITPAAPKCPSSPVLDLTLRLGPCWHPSPFESNGRSQAPRKALGRSFVCPSGAAAVMPPTSTWVTGERVPVTSGKRKLEEDDCSSAHLALNRANTRRMLNEPPKVSEDVELWRPSLGLVERVQAASVGADKALRTGEAASLAVSATRSTLRRETLDAAGIGLEGSMTLAAGTHSPGLQPFEDLDGVGWRRMQQHEQLLKRDQDPGHGARKQGTTLVLEAVGEKEPARKSGHNASPGRISVPPCSHTRRSEPSLWTGAGPGKNSSRAQGGPYLSSPVGHSGAQEACSLDPALLQLLLCPSAASGSMPARRFNTPPPDSKLSESLFPSILAQVLFSPPAKVSGESFTPQTPPVHSGEELSEVAPACQVQASQRGGRRTTQEYTLLYRCHICGKEFAKPQALGGHMHCHKKPEKTGNKEQRV